MIFEKEYDKFVKFIKLFKSLNIILYNVFSDFKIFIMDYISDNYKIKFSKSKYFNLSKLYKN